MVRNIKVYDTYRSAIAIESVQGGIIENILVEDISAKNTGNAIFIRIGQIRNAKKPGVLRNVTIRNMKVKVPYEHADYDYTIRGPELPFFHNVIPSSITGLPDQRVENVGFGKYSNYLPRTRETRPMRMHRYLDWMQFRSYPASIRNSRCLESCPHGVYT